MPCLAVTSVKRDFSPIARHQRHAVEWLERRILLSATPTSISVSASTTSAVYGQGLNLTASVSASPSAPNEGNVAFFDNGASLGTAPVSSGSAALDNLHLPVGTNSITASYSDTSGNFASSSAAAVGPNTTINTIAGGLGSGLPATAASIGYATNIVVDSSGNLFIPDLFGNVVREVQSGTGNLVTAAGNGLGGFSGDGGAATAATIYNPQGVAVDSSGDLFIADYGNHIVREVDHATGVITTVAGNGTAGYSGDGGAATAAELSSPVDVAVFGGNLFICDLANVIREVNLTTGVITTVAGNGTRGFSGDGGAATAAELAAPQGIAFDSAGDLFIADNFNYRVREVDHATGNITTVAGNGSFGFASGDGGAATAATIGEPYAVAVDPSSGDLFIADTISNKVRKVVNPTGAGVISTVAGTGFSGYSGDGGPGTAAELNYPDGLAVDASGDLYIAEQNGFRVRKVVLATDTITTAAGNGDTFFGGDGHPATEAQFTAVGIAVDPSGNVAIADGGNNRVREVNHATGIMSTVAGNGTRGFNGDGGAATAAELISPQAVAFDSSGNLFIAEGNDIREVNQATGNIATVAGNGSPGFTGDGGAATAAELRDPEGIAVDSSGDLFIADTFNQRVREVDHATGVITTVAGDGTGGFGGDGGQATAAELAGPTGVAVDSTNHLLFIADEGNDRIREVNLATGVITTVAGNGTAGYGGDGGAATAAELKVPQGIALDGSGDLFIGDTENRRVREVDLATGTITTVAGNGTLGVSGDGGPASSAELILYPNGVAVDSSGDLLIGDDIRLRELANGAVVVNVTPAPLTISADDKSKPYGAVLPTLTASYSGFVNGDTAASLTTQPTLSTTATASSHVSGNPYPITVGGASDPNYTISYASGSLTVTPVALTITADDKSKAYGAPLPTLTASYSGFVNGDTAASLTTQPTLSTTATAGSHVSGSPYPITASGAADSDYTISYVSGSLTVTPVALTITADDKSKAYGAPLPTLTASFSGFVNGDTAASLTTQPTLSTTATAGSHVSGSPYPITASGAADSDYTISYVAGSLTVTPVALTITADDKSKAVGAPLPTLTASYSGFVNGDTAASLTTQPTLSTTATPSSPPGTYPITVQGAADPDYTITDVAGTLTVVPASQPGSIQFSAATFNADETDASATITLMRTGGSTGAVSVTVGVNGGSAIAGTDYNFTSQTVSWADGDTADKNVTIPLIDDNATGESNETLNVALSNAAGGATIGTPNTATLTIAEDNDVVSGQTATYLNGQPGDGTVATLIHNLYRETLGREPDAGGQTFWTNVYTQAATGGNVALAQQTVVAGFLASLEYREHLVAGMYFDLLHRTAEASGLQFWAAKMAAGEGEKNVLAEIVGSDEYFADAGGTAAGFFSATYRDLLGRTAEGSGATFWTTLFTLPPPALSSIALPHNFRTAVAQIFLNTPEANLKLLNGNFPSSAGSVGAPGTPAVGAFAVADLTGNGWDNLYFQGNLSASAVDLLFAQLQAGASYDDTIAGMLDRASYFGT
ncbi:MAG TPA: MBG domain-containing protein [Pirellulales bacterium]|nr:MBG domain-containing protein [Pirellulales bacterium]